MCASERGVRPSKALLRARVFSMRQLSGWPYLECGERRFYWSATCLTLINCQQPLTVEHSEFSAGRPTPKKTSKKDFPSN
jgi:hypothetical protein